MIENSSSLSIYLVYAFNIIGQQSIDHLNLIMMRNGGLSWLWTVIRTLLQVSGFSLLPSYSVYSTAILLIGRKHETSQGINDPRHSINFMPEQYLHTISFWVNKLSKNNKDFLRILWFTRVQCKHCHFFKFKVLYLLLPSQVVKRKVLTLTRAQALWCKVPTL